MSAWCGRPTSWNRRRAPCSPERGGTSAESGNDMANVISLIDAKVEQPAPASLRRPAKATVVDFNERRSAGLSAAEAANQAARDVALRAQRLGALDGQTVQVCWEQPDRPGETRYAVGFQYGHTETELLLAFYTSGPDKMGPTLQIPVAGVRNVLQLSPEKVCY